jgi:hypothetical protein
LEKLEELEEVEESQKMLGRFLTTLPLFSRLKWKQIIEKGYLKKFEFIT